MLFPDENQESSIITKYLSKNNARIHLQNTAEGFGIVLVRAG